MKPIYWNDVTSRYAKLATALERKTWFTHEELDELGGEDLDYYNDLIKVERPEGASYFKVFYGITKDQLKKGRETTIERVGGRSPMYQSYFGGVRGRHSLGYTPYSSRNKKKVSSRSPTTCLSDSHCVWRKNKGCYAKGRKSKSPKRSPKRSKSPRSKSPMSQFQRQMKNVSGKARGGYYSPLYNRYSSYNY